MTLSEFRSWLEGFEEAINGSPTEEQWVKIKAKFTTVRDGAKHAPYFGVRDGFWFGPGSSDNDAAKIHVDCARKNGHGFGRISDAVF